MDTKYTVIESNIENGITQLNTDKGRYYQTPQGKIYPSSTTVVGLLNKKAIEQWEQRVGKEKADQIRTEAAAHGSRWHLLMEDTLNKGKQNLSFTHEFCRCYKKVLKDIFPKITKVHAVERRMYSDEIEVAGTADLIADYNGMCTILDWKTTSHFKSAQDVVSYWCQLASYAVMAKERMNLDVKQFVLVFNDSDVNIYTLQDCRIEMWIENFKKLRLKYKQLTGE